MPPTVIPMCALRWLYALASFGRFPPAAAEAADQIARLLADNPHTTLQVVLEPTGDPERLTVETLELLLAACYRDHDLSRSLLQPASGPAVGLETSGGGAAVGQAEPISPVRGARRSC